MLIGYNTNGFAHHRLEDAIEILGEIGYRSVAITVDHHALNPYGPELEPQMDRVRRLLASHAMRCTIETGSRFLLDPRRKHWPTLLEVSADLRIRRLDFLTRCLLIAENLGADALSFWSGARPSDVSDTHAMEWLVHACTELAARTSEHGPRLAFEPEPEMFIERMEQFDELHQRVNHPRFGLTLDMGHVHCLQNGRIEDHLTRWREQLFNLHLEDMRAGRHEHLMFGEGELDIPAIMSVLRRMDYQHGVHVELSRHSHDAVRTARAAYTYLQAHLGK